MKAFFKTAATLFQLGFLFFFFLGLSGCRQTSINSFRQRPHPPRIEPDYSDVVIPPNIAPLNFVIQEEGDSYFVVIHKVGEKDRGIRIKSKKNLVKIPAKKWRNFLSKHVGQKYSIDVYIKDKTNGWVKFQPIVNTIASEKIDSHVAYRLINPGYVLWWDMGIYQRDLETFKQSTIFSNQATNNNCMNCHSFCMGNPKQLMFHMRADYGGTILLNDGRINKIDTSTPYTMSAGVYPAWHPDGRHIAFSVNKIHQLFYNRKDKSILVYDNASDLVIYDINSNTITTSPKVSTKRAENLPTWSPDGKFLYFCSAPQTSNTQKRDEVLYDLCRIACDTQANSWGEVETVIQASDFGLSISFPKISPDGSKLLFCASNGGYFNIHNSFSDLYMLDLKTKQIDPLPVNSRQSEGYHSWSSNSRWFVFASKRDDGLCSRLYFSYVDDSGVVGKPFLLPQKDPRFYDTFIMNYNVPEIITGPVKVNHLKLVQTAHGDAKKAQFDSTVNIDALSGATWLAKHKKDAD